MDKIDLEILSCLKENARMKASDISKKINLSLSAVIERIKKMEAAGIIGLAGHVLGLRRGGGLSGSRGAAGGRGTARNGGAAGGRVAAAGGQRKQGAERQKDRKNSFHGKYLLFCPSLYRIRPVCHPPKGE